MAAEGQIPKKEGLRMWRSDEHRGTMLKGGRGRCCGRVCCCTIIIAIILIVGIVASFFRKSLLLQRAAAGCQADACLGSGVATVWIKPPGVSFDGIEGPATGSEVAEISDGFSLNIRLKVSRWIGWAQSTRG